MQHICIYDYIHAQVRHGTCTSKRRGMPRTYTYLIFHIGVTSGEMDSYPNCACEANAEDFFCFMDGVVSRNCCRA